MWRKPTSGPGIKRAERIVNCTSSCKQCAVTHWHPFMLQMYRALQCNYTEIIGHCDTVGNGKSVTTSNLSQYPIISVYLSTVFVWFCLVSGVSLHRRHLFNFPEHWNSESRFAVTLICPPESHLGAPIVEIPPEEKSFRGFYINLFSFWGLIKILKSNNSPFLWCKIMSNPIEIIFSINAPFFSFTCPFFLPVRPWDGATRRANL